ncbi:cadherin-23 [Aplysia californica]|uniref:Cadherin-23 n=1 Tax=Aplysia californica TaxID=6500 RepID=A0ABM0ZX89_APLCA|nr:cadherin-23 [Aplysia californica]
MTLVFKASNTKYKNVLAQITLYIQPVNDEVPQLINLPYSFKIPENSPVNEVVYTQVTGTDRDVGDVLNYTFQGSDSSLKDVFTIDPVNGNITLRKKLDFEKTTFYQYVVVVKDKANHNASADVFISVENVQDTPPAFDRGQYAGSVKENSATGTSILQVTAEDGDKGVDVSNGVTYNITSESCPGKFKVVRDTGEVQVNTGDLDRDGGLIESASGICRITVQATEKTTHPQTANARYTADVNVTITVQDVDDNRPRFSFPTYNASVDENTQNLVPIDLPTKIEVSDKDQGANAKFTVQITTDQRENFEVSPTEGQSKSNFIIRVKNSTYLDFEKRQTVTIKLVAQGPSPSGWNATADVVLHIRNVNDYSPQFKQTTIMGDVEENSPNGTSVTTVKADDGDKEDGRGFSKVTYHFQKPSNTFKIDNKTGQITVAGGLDREKRDVYYLTVIAVDGGDRSTSAQLQVKVTDQNDEAPVFSSDVYETSLKEGEYVFSHQITVHANDGDQEGTNNSKVFYKIESSIPSSVITQFHLDQASGLLTVKTPLKYEEVQFTKDEEGRISLNISATDNGIPPKKNFTTVSVQLQDVNNQSPSCEQMSYSVQIPENVSASYIVQHINATDEDKTSPNNLTVFRIDDKSVEVFSIDLNGTLSVRGILDRETIPHYDIIVTVSDLGNPSLSGSCFVSVNVTDVNDSPPTFDQRQMSKSIQENKKFDLSCHASDDDNNSDLVYTIDWDKSTGKDGGNKDVTTEILKKFFEIPDIGTCRIVSKINLDREQLSQVSLAVSVQDLNGIEYQVDTAHLSISVEDENDETPTFNSHTFMASIRENSPVGSSIQFHSPDSMIVKDKDKGNNSFFKVELLTYSDIFKLTPEEGQSDLTVSITVADQDKIDFEKQNELTLKIVAVETKTNEKQNSTTSVTVKIINENDNMPKFSDGPFDAHIQEPGLTAHCYITLNATDKDLGDNITFSLKDDSNKFQIDPVSGCVSLKSSDLDRETTSTYSITVMAEDDGGFKDTSQLTVHVLDANDEPPVFTSSLYNASIDEGSTTFIPALKVQATDDDEPGSPNSEVTYELLNARPSQLFRNFSIGGRDGEICLLAPLDFEEFDSVTLVIRASDNGTHKLETNASVIITVKDINDEVPKFLQSVYVSSVAENSTKGTFVANVTATDADASEPNNVISYTIDTLSKTKFSINESTGEISIKAALDREQKDSYTITVTARDYGQPMQTSTASVNVSVTDVNDSPPRFKNDKRKISIPENTANLTIQQFTVSDPDKDHQLQCNIAWEESSYVDGMGQFFQGQNFSNIVTIDKNSCEVKAVKELDREKLQQFTLSVVVTDLKGDPSTQQNATASLEVSVLDKNDNPPKFEGGDRFVAQIPENRPKGTEVVFVNGTRLVVKDIDEKENSLYEIVLSNGSGFAISPKEGNGVTPCRIIVEDPTRLDFEKNESITFEVTAIEKTSKRTQRKRNSTASITVLIINENDNVPTFEKSSYTAYVPENSPSFYSITTLKANDDDKGDFGIVKYSINEQTSLFSISESTGEVQLNCSAQQFCRDRETKSSYTVTVKAQDSGLFENTAQLTVTVTDVNDNTPQFEMASRKTEIPEGKTVFPIPFFLRAKDADEIGTNNSVVVYSILSVPNITKGAFDVNTTSGQLMMNKALDYEEVMKEYDNGCLSLKVSAQDLGSPSKNSSERITVCITDVNDVCPVFYQTMYNGTVKENSKQGTHVVKVEAQDDDGTYPNNGTKFAIQSGGQDKFQINSTSGEISVSVGAQLDRETDPSFTLKVLAIDRGIPPNTAIATVSITVEDVNDVDPVFAQSVVEHSVKEDACENHSIVQLNATDEDSNPNLVYSIDWRESRAYSERDQQVDILKVENWISVDNHSGLLYVTSSVLDRECAEKLLLKVIVNDSNAEQNGPQLATATVTIKIEDVNDNAPVINEGQSLTLNISEATRNGTEIYTFSATDADKAQRVNFTVADTSFFQITHSGKVSIKKLLDREKNATMHFIVIATDNGVPPLSSNTTVFVNVLDSNDNDPEIKGSTIFYVPESSDNTTLVAKINASDADAGDNANVTFLFKEYPPFRINPITGQIFVNGTLDREKKESYTVTVIARDNPLLEQSRRSAVSVTIKLEDVNDNSPVFGQSSYTSDVEETRPINKVIQIDPRAISAQDADIGVNANFSYSFHDPDNTYFQIDPASGVISVRESLLNLSGVYRYTVKATDHGSPSQSGNTNVTITIHDENLFDPQFTNDGPIPSIPECAKKDSFVYQFTAKDDDRELETNAAVRFRLDNTTKADDWKKFRIDEMTGKLYVIEPLDKETKSHLYIKVVAYDLGKPSSRSASTKTLDIEVSDVNDNPPKFPADLKTTFEVEENNVTKYVGRVQAQDRDQSARLIYNITDMRPNDYRDHFMIDKDSGKICLSKPLDRETHPDVMLTVTVKDMDISHEEDMCPDFSSNIKNSDNVEVKITVLDVDDSPPVFSLRHLTKGYLSSTEFGKTIFTLTDFVEDKDTAKYRVHQFHKVGDLELDESLSKSWVDKQKPDPVLLSSNGSITTNVKFNDDASGAFTLIVTVSDHAGNDTIPVKIYVVGDSQAVRMTFFQSEEQLRRIQFPLTKEFDQLGYEFVPDNIQPKYNQDRSVDGSKSVLVVHAVDKDGNIVDGSTLIGELDRMDIKLKLKLQDQYKFLETKVGKDTFEVTSNDKRTEYILIAVIAAIAITFVITLYFMIHNIRRFKHKLKAATIEVHALEPVKQDRFPGLDNDHLREANPVFMRDDLTLGDSMYDYPHSDASSHSSQNSLDENEINAPEERKKSVGYDEQEITLNIYGQDPTEGDMSNLPKALYYLNSAFEGEEKQIQRSPGADLSEDEQAMESDSRVQAVQRHRRNLGIDMPKDSDQTLDFDLDELETTDI